MLLDQIDTLGGQIERLTAKIEETITQISAANPPAGGPSGGPGAAAHTAIQPARSVSGHADPVDPETGEVMALCLPVGLTAWTRSQGSAATTPRS
jgi:hypothetical protein